MIRHIQFCAIALVGLAGCSGSESMYPVQGKIQHNNKALAKGSIVLYPDTAKGNNTKHEPRASIDADGTYKVSTHPREGAPAGWYKVAVLVTEPSDPKNMYSAPKSLIPEKYGKPAESGLALEVRKDAQPGAYDLDLKQVRGSGGRGQWSGVRDQESGGRVRRQGAGLGVGSSAPPSLRDS